VRESVQPKSPPALPQFILDLRTKIAALCVDHHVTRLELFGSATAPEFDSGSIDADFLVEWGPDSIDDVVDTYFAFSDDLAALLERKVYLVSYRGIKNPYLQRSIDEQRVALYAA
jgi:uncharacterized protein